MTNLEFIVLSCRKFRKSVCNFKRRQNNLLFLLILILELIICDEGHKLKNAEIKTTKAVASLPGKRRVILSGTPIQNNLDEFYAMVNFVNPEGMFPFINTPIKTL